MLSVCPLTFGCPHKIASTSAVEYRDAKVEKAFRQHVPDPKFELVDVSSRLMLVFEGKNIAGTLYLSPALCFVCPRLSLVVHVLEMVDIEQLGSSTLRLLLRDEMLLEFVSQHADIEHEVRILRGIWRDQVERTSFLLQQPNKGGIARAAAAGFFTREIMSDPLEFSSDYAEWSQERMTAWKDYLLRFGRGSFGRLCQKPLFQSGKRIGTVPIKCIPQFEELVADGIPGLKERYCFLFQLI